MDGQQVFTLSIPRGAGTPAESNSVHGYTYIDGVAHRSPTTIDGDGTLVSPGSEGVELTLGSHPLADELRSLGLPAPALMSTWTEHMRGSFEAPEKLRATARPQFARSCWARASAAVRCTRLTRPRIQSS